jgi:hypothetical protein
MEGNRREGTKKVLKIDGLIKPRSHSGITSRLRVFVASFGSGLSGLRIVSAFNKFSSA